MNLIGDLQIGSASYYLYVNDIKRTIMYYLITKQHREDTMADLLGEKMSHPVITNVTLVGRLYDLAYLSGCVCKTKVTGKITTFGNTENLSRVLETLSFAKNYKFSEENILLQKESIDLGKEVRRFSASDSVLQYSYEEINGQFTSVSVTHGGVVLRLKTTSTQLPKNFTLVEAKTSIAKQVQLATLATIDYEMLKQLLDLSWYEKDGKILKNYSCVDNVRDFELNVITKIVKEMIQCHERAEILDVSLDTETTGLGIHNLADDNPARDHCVAIPISWEEDQAVLIFVDMEHFENIPCNYAASRLAELFCDFEGIRKIEYWEEGQTSDAPLVSQNVEFERKWINLIGHNIIFDAKVFLLHQHPIYFDDDTLQMAFVLNPKTVSGSKKLKTITRILFKHETPELETILGKGNEDKFKYLTDKLVAMIYGCADADYTRKVKMKLRVIMSTSMYVRYRQQDITMLNILSKSEFMGMMTYSEEVKELASQVYNNIEILKNAMYSYVGVYVNYVKQRNIIEAKKKANLIQSKKEYESAINAIMVDQNSVYEFEFKATQFRNILFQILGYPIFKYTPGEKKLPAIDKFAIKKLMAMKLDNADTSERRLLTDVLVYGANREEYLALSAGTPEQKKTAEKMVLISAKEFNSLKYPLALILQKFADLNKEYTSYYKPIMKANLEGKMFYNYSLARIETRRIMNPGQTMKGDLKALVRSYSDDYYLVDFDMSQVEYRIMLSLAQFILMIDKMNHPENDYHTETAALINFIPAHKVSKKLRKLAKSVSFGVPYGLGEMRLCETLFGEVNSENLLLTRMMLLKWKENNKPIMTFLEKCRDDALVEQTISNELRDFADLWKKDENKEYVLDEHGNKIPIPIGKSENEFGFYRIFDLTDVPQTEAAKKRRKEKNYTKEEAAIRRPAGNYPIQSFAAEVFRIILIRFYERCKKEGLNDKLIWHMLIHDELLLSVHKSINPILMYKIIKESCMITMPGHTKYFVGINIGETWAECKDDAREAPVLFVDRMIKRYDAGEFQEISWFDHPWEFIKPLREQYIQDRIGEALRVVQSDLDEAPIDIAGLIERFDNYTVRAYIFDYPQNHFVSNDFDQKDAGLKAKYDDDVWISRLESWVLAVFGEGKEMISLDGNVYRVRKGAIAEKVKENFIQDNKLSFDDFVPEEEDDWSLGEDGLWSFEDTDAVSKYNLVSSDCSANEENPVEFNYGLAGAKSVADIVLKEKTYNNLQIINKQLVINPGRHLLEIKKYLLKQTTTIGLQVIFRSTGKLERWIRVKDSTSLEDLDLFISTLDAATLEGNLTQIDNSQFQHLKIVNHCLIINICNLKQAEYFRKLLMQYKGTDLCVHFRNAFGELEKQCSIRKDIDFRKLEKLLVNWR